MEARSLASLNHLAANPPQYPVKPQEQLQEPLTLYISRVPGTRDVILTTTKPQVENVTAADVTSSLYYIQFENSSPQSRGPTPPRHHYDNARSSDESAGARRAIPRKPIGAARPPTPDEPPAPLLNVPLPSEQPPSPGSSELPEWYVKGQPPAIKVPETVPSTPAVNGVSPPSATDMPARKPVASSPITPVEALPTLQQPAEPFTSVERPYSQQSWHERDGVPDYAKPPHERPYSQQSNRSRADRPLSQPRSAEKPYHALPPPPYSEHPALRGEPQAPPLPRRPRATSVNQPGQAVHASVHRRAESQQLHRPMNSRSPSPKKLDDSFSLNIIRRDPSSGHQWNVGHIFSCQLPDPVTAPYPEELPRPPIDVHIQNPGYSKFKGMPARKSVEIPRQPNGIDQPPPETATFSRQLVMSYSKSFASNVKDVFQKRSRSGSKPAPLEPETSLGQPGPGMKPRGYVFVSPWDTRCEFYTSVTGGSVRCRHLLNDGRGNTNSLVTEDFASPFAHDSAVVSELRFNLPAYEMPGFEEQTTQQKMGSLAKFWRRDDISLEDGDDGSLSPFEMNLGKERAGGGQRGRRAKLGKLIINHEGLKMLDLLVAANMGVWWRTWEKSF